jgi:class 3 adenylate cyclase/tetratricopeptide (TPR) repeat protein
MTFYEVVGQVLELLQREGRVSYRALKRQFTLDDEYLEDLKAALIEAKQLAADEGGRVLVWIGAPTTASMSTSGLSRAPAAYTPPYLAEKILTSKAALEGERKQVTVLFADLKGSMELLADRDSEDARRILDPMLERMMAAVHRYEGTVNQVMGDGIMALFGAPIAHEDHAIRACYAALAMQTSVKQYVAEVQRTRGVPIHIRVGLNSGEVVVRSIGSDLHMDYTAVGQTTHLAARMERMAMPGSILITADVLRLAEGYVQVTSLGPVPIKGLPDPAEVYEGSGAGPVRTRLFPERKFTFKHALTHEVAYSGLLQERRRGLHARIVEALERLYAARLDEQVERLAHHAFRGDVWDNACSYYRQAGAKAMEQSAYPAVVVSYEQALAALGHLPHERETLEQVIDLYLAMRPALVALADGERQLSHLRTAETLATTLNDQRRLGRIYSGLVSAYRRVSNTDRALTYSRRCHTLATTSGDMGFQIASSQRLGQLYYDLGDYHQAMAYFRNNVAALQGALLYERFDVGTFNALPALTARLYLVLCLAEVGEFAEGIAYGDEALRLVEGIDRRYDRMVVPLRVGQLYLRQGNVSKAIPLLEQALALGQSADMQLSVRQAQAVAALAVAYAWSGHLADTTSLLKDRPYRTDIVLCCSEAYLLTGHVAEASQLVQRALAHSRDHQEQGYQVHALWLLGEVAAHRDPPEVEPAEAHYRQSLALADECGMRPLQAHCHLDLGRLYATLGQQQQARSELSTAIDLYRTMDMTFWLPQAEAALTQVEGR